MPFVQRNSEGIVTGEYANLQAGFAEEWLPEGHEALSASLSSLLQNRNRFLVELSAIDEKSIRSLRALAVNPANLEEAEILNSLELRAVEIRKEIAAQKPRPIKGKK